MARVSLNEQLLQQCMHRYRSLEVELNDAARNGSIQAADYASRLHMLQQLGQRIASLEVSAASTKITVERSRVMDLPLLEECSREEQRIIVEALGNSKKLAEKLLQDIETLKDGVRSATSQDSNWIKMVFRLSWLRARMSWADTQLTTTRSVRGMLETFIRRVAPQKQGQAAQADLVEAFREFETTTSRIGYLRSKLRSEIAKNHDQEDWLKRYEAARKRSSTPVAPPVPAELEMAKNDVAARFLEGSKNATDRLVIARKLAESLTKETREKASQKTLEKKPEWMPGPAKKARTKNDGKGAAK